MTPQLQLERINKRTKDRRTEYPMRRAFAYKTDKVKTWHLGFGGSVWRTKKFGEGLMFPNGFEYNNYL